MKLQNHFLISIPSLAPSDFSHTVTYICDHSDNGALGFIINRETNLALTDVFKQMAIQIDHPYLQDDPVHQGGPIQQDKGFVLHQSRTNHWKASLNITEDIRVTTSKDVLEDFAHNKLSKGKMLLLGYASWEPGQIEKEISRDNFWLVVPADLDIIFEVPVNQRLEAAAGLIGVDLSRWCPMLSDLPEPPSELIFGIDFGERYIGCAIGNTLSRSAQPLSSIVYQYPNYPLQELCALIQTWQPQKLVIGEPFHMDGSRSQTSERCDIFIKALERQCFLPIFRIDERLSTHAAKERIENLPRKKDRRDKRVLNSIAAQIILETWLNR